MKPIIFVLSILIALSSVHADAASKRKSKTKLKKITQTSTYNPIAINYPSISSALTAIKARVDMSIKPNAKPFGWQDRSGPWYVANEPSNTNNASMTGRQKRVEWAFTEAGHYAHPSLIKRMIDIGSADHVYVDMAVKCGAANSQDCDQLFAEMKELNLLIRKVYQKKYIKTAEGEPAWNGVDHLE
jgi:hypothetical protein